MKDVLDHDLYPPNERSDLEWEKFTVPFVSTDREYSDGFGDLCDKHKD